MRPFVWKLFSRLCLTTLTSFQHCEQTGQRGAAPPSLLRRKCTYVILTEVECGGETTATVGDRSVAGRRISLVEIFLRISQKLSSIFSFLIFWEILEDFSDFFRKFSIVSENYGMRNLIFKEKRRNFRFLTKSKKKSPIFSRYLVFPPNSVKLRN